MNRQPVIKTLRELADEIYEVSFTLFKIMIPTLIVIKLLEEVGAHISGALWLRIAFAIIVISLLSRWLLSRSNVFKERYLYTNRQT